MTLLRKNKPALAKHLPCPTCEYDLCGLAEELQYDFGLVEKSRRVQCPECGEIVDVGTALRQLRAMRIRATVRALAFSIGSFTPFACFAVVSFCDGQLWQVAVAMVLAPIWLSSLWLYRHGHRHVDYAAQVLLMLHCCAAAAIIGVTALVYVFEFVPGSPGPVGGLLVLAGVCLAVAWRLFWEARGLIEDGHDLCLHRVAGGPDL